MAQREVLSHHRIVAMQALCGRLERLIGQLETVDRQAPATAALRQAAGTLFADARRLLGETAFYPLPRRAMIMPADLFVTALSVAGATNALLRQAKFARGGLGAKIYPRRSRQH